MKYPLSELIDRYSILHLKVKRLPENKAVLAEYQRFEEAIKEFNADADGFIEKMIEINGRIWDLESAIRMTDSLPLEEIGKRTIQIRNINRERIAMKNKIAEQFNEFQEIKVDHPSA